MPTSSPVDVLTWLDTLPLADGNAQISTPRRFQHDEQLYDQQYHNDPAAFAPGQGLTKILQTLHIDCSRPALEIGCGTGHLSLGMVAYSPFPAVILSDPSPVFLEITRRKIQAQNITTQGVRYATLVGEEVAKIPENTLSCVALRSTVHHVTDVDAFLSDCARVLAPGGVLVFQEPCAEGYMLMGAIASMFPATLKGVGVTLTAPQREQMQLFIDTMRFYCRRDVDKTQAEDKHVFRVDELMATGRRLGMDVAFYANQSFDSLRLLPTLPPATPFGTMFFNYLKYCMSWDEAMLAIFREHLAGLIGFVDEASGGYAGPYHQGVFVCRKR